MRYLRSITQLIAAVAYFTLASSCTRSDREQVDVVSPTTHATPNAAKNINAVAVSSLGSELDTFVLEVVVYHEDKGISSLALLGGNQAEGLHRSDQTVKIKISEAEAKRLIHALECDGYFYRTVLASYKLRKKPDEPYCLTRVKSSTSREYVDIFKIDGRTELWLENVLRKSELDNVFPELAKVINAPK